MKKLEKRGSLPFNMTAYAVIMIIIIAIVIIIIFGVKVEGKQVIKTLMDPKKWLGFAGK